MEKILGDDITGLKILLKTLNETLSNACPLNRKLSFTGRYEKLNGLFTPTKITLRLIKDYMAFLRHKRLLEAKESMSFKLQELFDELYDGDSRALRHDAKFINKEIISELFVDNLDYRLGGNVYALKGERLGFASIHFELPLTDNLSYINFSRLPLKIDEVEGSSLLDESFPEKKYFTNVQWLSQSRTFKGKIDWGHNTVFNGD